MMPMIAIGQIERLAQNRVVQFFKQELGYRYLGNWESRPNNSNIEPDLLRAWLQRQGHGEPVIKKVLEQLRKAREVHGSRSLYDANRDVYGLLRYGVKVRPEIGEHHETIWLVDWEHPGNNDFAIAEEVTILGQHTKRPDIVLYVNGLALAVLELKRSTVNVSEGVRQNLDNQTPTFIRDFFATIQLVLAGNETEGLRYGVIETPEKHFMTWRDDCEIANPLHRGLYQLCRKPRLLEIIHDFIVFDAGTKKSCRHNQYFGVQAAQEHIRRRAGGIIWHTQGSGKSLTMTWLARWIREHITDARVLIITDRVELDEQIEKVFKGVNEDIYRTRSGADLMDTLNASQRWLICSLVHKFHTDAEGDVDSYIQDLRSHLPRGFKPKGSLFVFVDECHRTQSGKLHQAMKKLLPDAVFIGFTGTPLLRADKVQSIEIFGPYIHTYKYDEAVKDGVVLDLRYEARDIDQIITSQERIDQWFAAKTRGLNDYTRARLKARWGTIKEILSSQTRLEKIVADILLDMETRPRLLDEHGNAMLVSDSIYNACRFYEMFQKSDLAGRCAIITSYRPNVVEIRGETSGEGETEELLKYNTYRRMVAARLGIPEDAVSDTSIETFEQEVKKRFIHEPGQMRLLIVVDKLLTGFDAPPATYLYIDKPMRDHGLFQAICRVNRLDTEDKEYGYIIDYRDLFESLATAIHDYTGGAFEGYDAADVQGLLQDRLSKARERLEETREALRALCELVPPPQDTLAYIHYFCAKDSGNAEELKANEPRRMEFYKLTAALIRAYANLANEMEPAGYTAAQAKAISTEVDTYFKIRAEIRLASGENIDLKLYEPAMRQLMDWYIQAQDSQKLSAFDDLSLVELLVNRGAAGLEDLPASVRGNQTALAEAIENNVRRLIIDKMAINPEYYQNMSDLLDALIKQRRQQAINYKEYLDSIIHLTRQIKDPATHTRYPAAISTTPRMALYDNLGQNETLAVQVDEAILAVKQEDWRNNTFKRRQVRSAIKSALGGDDALTDKILEIVMNQHEY